MKPTNPLSGSETQLAPSLLQAYLETEYGVASSNESVADFNLKVGAVSAHLLTLHKRQGVECSAYITPCNPLGESLCAVENESRLTAFRAQLHKRSLLWLEGVGAHSDGQWPGEPSFLVLGLSLESAKLLAKEQAQNAFVWVGKDGVPHLVLLR